LLLTSSDPIIAVDNVCIEEVFYGMQPAF
jgi:hypothetical protein